MIATNNELTLVVARTTRLLTTFVLACAGMPPALAMRPFDGTDAAVVPQGGLEFEFGYLGLLRDDGRTFLSSPALVANMGVAPGTELVAEGRLRTRLGARDSTIDDMALSVKHVFQKGVLQDAHGPSAAGECGVLLPAAEGERTGLACTGIVSQRVARMTLHVDGTLAKNRDRQWERALGMIVEGPRHGKVEPVFEAVIGTAGGGERVRSALAGLLVEAADNINLDVGLRVAGGTTHVAEVRAGLTWSPR
jgi:hypothetical protein